jgi:NOL1/NOP2/fmu family ribosome biogenesis protein
MTRAWTAAGACTRTTSTRWDSSWPACVLEPQRSAVLGYFEERFGIPLTAFAAYRLLERHKIYVLTHDSPHLEALASLKVHSLGLPLLRKMRHACKPTTVALQRFGHQATRHMLELLPAQMRQLMQEHELPLHLEWSPGYIILLYEGHILGCGLYTPGRLRSQIPSH